MKCLSAKRVFFSALMGAISLLGPRVWGDDSVPSVELQCQLDPAGSFRAKSLEVSGVVTTDGTNLSAKNVELKVATLKTGVSLRDKHLLEHLESDKFPTAVLLEASGSNGVGKGKLKVHGVVKDIQLKYKKLSDKLIQGEFVTHLTDYNIKEAKYMGVGVDDEVKVVVVLPLKASANGANP